ncbi:putative L-serine dehydratase [Aspergillus affinis]|uniref:putative L-serine dehydratase n=1 Tax=Aspergillus affinis TaxID=1070780 RepID=UPI0022FED743|nr:putative L-serine dehydratase [Aspergillus affinis]KAI9045770.1 putative L-serine dehydratase [Aspergillus affinis]
MRNPWIETPLIESAALSKTAGCKVFLKLELLQPSGSFKSRGIGFLILHSRLDPENDGKDLHFYIASGGNAGLAAVLAARDIEVPCTVVVPHSTKPAMITKLRAIGATDVLQHGSSWFEADTYLRQNFIDNQDRQPDAAKRKNIHLPPFDHPKVWEGAATMVEEIARQLPPPEDSTSEAFPADAIVCSVGGGGLFNGVVGGLETCLQSRKTAAGKDVYVVATETEGAHSLAHSIQHRSLQSLPAITSQATSLGALCVAPRTLQYAQAPPAGVKVVSAVGSDADAAQGVVRLADEHRLQVELACGISVHIGAMGRMRELVPDLRPESRVVVVVCGGSNVTAETIAEYRRQLSAGWT